MNFIWFLIRLILADFVAVIVMAIGTFIVSLPIILLVKIENKIHNLLYKGLSYISAIPMLIFMLLFWGFWAAYCVGITYQFSSASTYKWVYWVISFISCITFLSWLAYKEKQNIAVEYGVKEYNAENPLDKLDVLVHRFKEEKNVDRSTFAWQIYTIIIYAIFAFSPSLMIIIYGPALKFLGVLQ